MAGLVNTCSTLLCYVVWKLTHPMLCMDTGIYPNFCTFINSFAMREGGVEEGDCEEIQKSRNIVALQGVRPEWFCRVICRAAKE
jgi:hypothetical protein